MRPHTPADRRTPPTKPRTTATSSIVWRLTAGAPCSRAVERAGELGEDRQVGVEPYPVDPANPERCERPVVLEASELALDCGAPLVELAPAPRDQARRACWP